LKTENFPAPDQELIILDLQYANQSSCGADEEKPAFKAPVATSFLVAIRSRRMARASAGFEY
jgi:hypothetical protein